MRASTQQSSDTAEGATPPDPRTWDLYFALLAADTSSLSLVTTIGAVALSVVGALVTFAFQLSPSAAHRVPQYVWVAMPVLPIAIVGHLIHIGARGTLRGQYMREIEIDLRERGDGRHPVWIHLASHVDDPRPGRRAFWFLLVLIDVAGAVLVIGAGAVAWYWLDTTSGRVVMVGLNGALCALLLWPGILASVGADKLSRQARSELSKRLTETTTVARSDSASSASARSSKRAGGQSDDGSDA